MTTSLVPSLREGEKIPLATRVFFRERLRIKLHQLLLRQFMRWERETRLTKRVLADRVSKRPEVITRCLGAPSNLTLDTVSDLLLGMGVEATFDVRSLVQTLPAESNLQRDASEVAHCIRVTGLRADTMRAEAATKRDAHPIYEQQAVSSHQA
jgi:hypothetical protein